MLNGFRLILPLATLALFACAVPVRQPAESQAFPQSGPILNLRLLALAGPALAENSSLIDPACVAVNALGEIFISDRTQNTVFKLSPSLDLLAQEGGIGGGSGEFNRPLGMAFDAALNLYVADSGNRRIQIFDRNLHFVSSIISYFDENKEAVDFGLLSDIAVDREGNFWVADDNKVIKLDQFFNLLLKITDNSPGFPIFGKISSLGISRGGFLAIADNGNRRIILARTNGNFISDFPCGLPLSLSCDNQDRIWVAERGRIVAYNFSGNLEFIFAGDGADFRPASVAFDNSGRLLTLDTAVRRVKIYEVIKATASSGNK